MDVGEHTTRGDGHAAEQHVELLIVTDGELDVTRDDMGLLVVTGGVTGELEDLSSEVLEDGGEVHRGTSSDTGRIASFTKETRNTSDGELQTGASRARSGLATLLAAASFTFTFSSHYDVCVLGMFFKKVFLNVLIAIFL